jgi:hypothetical protein
LQSLLTVNGERMPATNRRQKINERYVRMKNARRLEGTDFVRRTIHRPDYLRGNRHDCLLPMERRENLLRYSHRPAAHREIRLRETHCYSHRRLERCEDKSKGPLVESRQVAAY